MDKGQVKRFSSAEIELIKKLVASREDAIYILRNHFLQFDLSDDEKAFLKSLTPDKLALIEKAMAPKLDKEIPLGQQATLESRLANLEQLNPDVGFLHIAANDVIGSYLLQQIAKLYDDTTEPTIVLNDLPKPLGVGQEDIRVANMIAFNNLIPIIDGRLNVLLSLANTVTETPEEAAKRAQANSTK